jgi:hypothetical protein
MPGNLICDICDKQIGDYDNAFFSDRRKDLDFCSKECLLAWGNSDGSAIQFKKSRMPGNRLDRSLKNNENLDEIINAYRNKNIDGATAGLVYNLGVETNEITLQGTIEYNSRVYDLKLPDDLKTFTRERSEAINPLNGNNWEDGGLSDKEKSLYIGEILNTPLSIHAAAVLLAHMRAIKGNQRLDGREGQEGNDDWTGENNQYFIDRITHVDEEHRLALEDFARAASQTNANKSFNTGWLTDDNIAFILNHRESGIQQALNRHNQNSRNWEIRTDIANIHNCFERARTNQEQNLTILLQELTNNPHRYTVFPLRVSGNHWGMFILENYGENKRVYYTSSGQGVENELEQVKPLIIQLTDQATANNIQIVQGPKQNNSWDCGVYLIKYIQELLETGNLVLTKNITEQDCQVFRQKWKEKITQEVGPGEWCKVDVFREENIKGDRPQSSKPVEKSDQGTQTSLTSDNIHHLTRERDNFRDELIRERQSRARSRERHQEALQRLQRRLDSDQQVLRDQIDNDRAARIIQLQETRWQRQGGNN